MKSFFMEDYKNYLNHHCSRNRSRLLEYPERKTQARCLKFIRYFSKTYY